MRTHKFTGMTLIELMVTIAILAVVTAIAIPAYNGYLKTSRFSEAHNQIAAVKLAQAEFFLDNNTYFDIASGDDPATESGGMYTTLNADLEYFDITVTDDPCNDITACYRVIATGKGTMSGESVSFDGP